MRNKFDKERIRSLVKKGDYGIMPAPMDAQTALNELRRYLLPEDWYIVDPVCTTQANTEIVCAIEKRYKGCKIKRNKPQTKSKKAITKLKIKWCNIQLAVLRALKRVVDVWAKHLDKYC